MGLLSLLVVLGHIDLLGDLCFPDLSLLVFLND